MGTTITLRCSELELFLNFPGVPAMSAAIGSHAILRTIIDNAFSDAGVSMKSDVLQSALSDALRDASLSGMEYLVSDKIFSEPVPGYAGSCKAIGFQLSGFPSDVYFWLTTTMTNHAMLECRRIRNRIKEVIYVVCTLETRFDALPPQGKIWIERKRQKNPMIGVLQKMLKFVESTPRDAVVEMFAA